jgi:hypothetical protein
MANCIIRKNYLRTVISEGFKFGKFKSGREDCMRNMQQQLGLLEPSQYFPYERGKPRKPVSRWPVAGPSGCRLTSSQQTGKQKDVRDSLTYVLVFY